MFLLLKDLQVCFPSPLESNPVPGEAPHVWLDMPAVEPCSLVATGFLRMELKMTYTGLYLILTEGIPTAVQVKEEGGNTLPLPLHEYISRAVQPKWETLPTQADGGNTGGAQ